ncbi:PRC-barrel domain-containing protein [Roseibium salinum]|uniref:PRC-barrel domain-containing protein n=1 Tax=Roseibium salinum TaxID=1604349 RepID=A0ABT3QXV1_9HYPH|nr:PRC-barrel domain-containing protein [Roseibium sp. DSM 29163]MCX2721774.1 PRC-barrel domain-containing protein [Roseibium sp. DSM 29163]MDN3720178.1 PRC-barrel domain-containing protein [Roseibium salinum]
MTSKFLTTATAAIALSLSPALAQEATQPQTDAPLIEETMPGTEAPAEMAPDTSQSDEMTPDVAQGDLEFLATQKDGTWLTSDLIGQDVTNPAGESIGEVAALEIGQDGRITTLIIDAGGFLGIGAKQVAVPFDAVEHVREGAETQSLVIQATLEEVESAPEYMTLLDKQREEEAAQAQMEAEQSVPSTTTEPMTAQ